MHYIHINVSKFLLYKVCDTVGITEAKYLKGQRIQNQLFEGFEMSSERPPKILSDIRCSPKEVEKTSAVFGNFQRGLNHSQCGFEDRRHHPRIPSPLPPRS